MRLLLLALVLSAAAVYAGETFVVAVGVERYDDQTISAVPFAVGDARSLAEAFRAGGVPEANLAILTSDDANPGRRPTRTNIRLALRRVSEGAESDATVILYFAGHGSQAGAVPFLYTVDTLLDDVPGTALPLSEIYTGLQRCRAKQVLVILDACRTVPESGRADGPVALDEAYARNVRALLVHPPAGTGPAVAVLTACEVGQRAWGMPDRGHGAFTWFLLKGLSGEAKGADGVVRLSGLSSYLSARVPDWAERAGRQQTPRLDAPEGFDLELLRPLERPTQPTGPTAPTGPGIEILRREGTLEIRANVSPVHLELDGQPVGVLQDGATLRRTLLIGPVQVRATAEGYVPLEQPAVIRQGATTTLTLTLLKLPGLAISTDHPQPVTVYVDDTPRGQAAPGRPVTVDGLTVGAHSVRVECEGWFPQAATVDLQGGETRPLTLTPLAMPTLTIEVEEADVEVLLDGQPVGTLSPATPAVVRNLAPGEHRLTARRGGENRERTVTLEPGREHTELAWAAGPPPGGFLRDYQPVAGMQYRVSPKDGMPQVLIPAGEFLMGSPDGEGDTDEHPQKRVFVSAFWMDVHEVTVGQYQRFCQATGGQMDTQYNKVATHPVVAVSWNEASAYAKWVGRELPTEAQWEKAARGGTTTAYPWGDQWNEAAANNGNGTKPVGSYSPNGFGLFDMSGNVWEWCRDAYDGSWYRGMPSRDPFNVGNANSLRVLRGGSWVDNPGDRRVADRNRYSPDYLFNFFGFRCSEAP